jgi:F420 biosynthesis protein FbiB-like protein
MLEKNEYINFLKNRRSVRKYLPKEVPLELIDCIVEAARWAPSAHNAQPWRFFIVREKGMKAKLAGAMAKRLQQDLEKDGIKPDLAVKRARGSFDRFSTSPVIIVACVDMSAMNHYADAFRQKAEEIMATQSLAAALQNLLLTANALGLGGCWFCAPLFVPEIVKKIVGIPDSHIPQALITLGYPKTIPTPPPRVHLDEIRRIL